MIYIDIADGTADAIAVADTAYQAAEVLARLFTPEGHGIKNLKIECRDKCDNGCMRYHLKFSEVINGTEYDCSSEFVELSLQVPGAISLLYLD